MIKLQSKGKNFKEKVKITAKNKIRNILKHNPSSPRLEVWRTLL